MEIWKDFESSSLEFDYQISNMGNVRSMNYNRTGKVKVLKDGFKSKFKK
jgi:NUMOD4 motif